MHDKPRRTIEGLEPRVARWVERKFHEPTEVQTAAVTQVLRGRSVLISSPTGTGKTLAAFLGIFDHLARLRAAGPLPDAVIAVYVSPLRALAYDLQKNIAAPLRQLRFGDVRIGLRTGDTTQKERAAQKRRPPHILVTTPESLALLLGQASWLPALGARRFLVIDEIHALAENKRGTHLMVSAERLQALRPDEPLCRIGLSATIAPLERVAEFLAGPGRPCEVVTAVSPKKTIIEVFSPLQKNPYPPAGWTATRTLKELAVLLADYRTTLIFTNTRSGAESIGLRLKRLLPKWAKKIEVHHASLDRQIRLDVEDRLKQGKLRAVVCSTSLEMGIDIGFIDLVVMISAPKGVSRALQRLGRSGHALNETSRGVLVASNINDLVECAVTARMVDARQLEPVRIPENAADVLAQHVVGLVASGDWTEDAIFALVRHAYSYRHLTREKFDQVLRYLEGGGVSLERQYGPVFGKIVRHPGGRLTVPGPRVARDYYQNVGTISSESMVVVKVKGRRIGEVEQNFIQQLNTGDVFVLNGRTIRLLETRLLEAKAEWAPAQLPTVPRWNANKMPLASGLAREVTRLRSRMRELMERDETGEAARAWLIETYNLSSINTAAILRQFAAQARVSAIPTERDFLIEVFPEGPLRHFFFHSLIGRSANDALSRVIAWRVKERKGGNALVTIDDYGFLMSLREFQVMPMDELKDLFSPDHAEEDLLAALRPSQLVKWQFRGVAQTGLMVPRQQFGRERPARALQWSTEIIFEVLQKYEPDHPLLAEAYHEAAHTFLDLPRAFDFLQRARKLDWQRIDVDRVSPFSFGIFVSKIKETMMMEDPETAIERLYHEFYRELDSPSLPDAERDG
ncbi:MAG: DEAD/DEAH box helicase [Verrucomicrobiota bacterium]